MSLVISVSVNDSAPIELLTAQRASGGEDPDSVNAYKVTRYRDYAEVGRRVVEHRYGDGALVLALKALEAFTPAGSER